MFHNTPGLPKFLTILSMTVFLAGQELTGCILLPAATGLFSSAVSAVTTPAATTAATTAANAALTAEPGQDATTASANSMATAIAAIDRTAVGRTVLLQGRLTSIRRQANGSAEAQLEDETGTITVFLDRAIGADLLSLSIDQVYTVCAPVQEYQGTLELKPNRPDAISLVGAYDFTAVTVARIVDGDTIHVRDRTGTVSVIRLIGVDCPETAKNGQPGEFYAAETTAYTRDQLLNRTVYLERDNSQTDRYGRLLRYVWLKQPVSMAADTIGTTNFSAMLICAGYAEAIVVGADDKYQDLFAQWEAAAQSDRQGLWARP